MELSLDLNTNFYGENKELPDPELWLTYQELQTGHLWLENEISLETTRLISHYIEYINNSRRNDINEIYLHINSPGGDIRQTLYLYNLIKTSTIPIYTINECDAHSGAFIIFLAGKRRMIREYSCSVVHEGSIEMSGTSRQTKGATKQYERELNTLKEIICRETTVSREELESQFEKQSDWYWNKEEFEKYGVIK